MLRQRRLRYYGFTMPKKKTGEQANRINQVLERLENAYPDAQCALSHRNPLELLVATILSAQCTDERVNIVTRDLFRKYRKPEEYAAAAPEVLEKDVRSTGFYRNKAKSIQGACKMIVENFGGSVPATMEELLLLPGVARKTANVVLGVAFHKAEGIVVDTHVYRVARRLDLTRSDTPENIERDLMQIIPKAKWIIFSHQMIFHGRQACKARKPLCSICPVKDLCYSEDKAV
jgi:endonuclease-3